MDYSVRVLGGRLTSDSAEDRRLAAETLGALGPRAADAVEVMILRSIVDSEPPVRYALLAALERVSWDPDAAVDAFVSLLDHDDEIAQARAAWALGRVGPAAARSVPDLVRIALDARRLVDPRWSAVVALGRLGPDAAAASPAFAELLGTDPNPDMREAAGRALGEVGGGDEAVPALVGALADPDQLVRESAVEGLGALGPSAAETVERVEALVSDPWPAVARTAASTIPRLEPGRGRKPSVAASPRQEVRAALRPLLAGLESKQERTRGISTFEIGKLGPEAAETVPLLAGLLGSDGNLDVRWSAAWALGKMGPEAAEAVPALARALTIDPDADVRGQSVWALGRVGEAAEPWAPVAAEVLVRALADVDSLVREEALLALVRIRRTEPSVLAAVAGRVGDARPLVRRRALAALVEIARPG